MKVDRRKRRWPLRVTVLGLVLVAGAVAVVWGSSAGADTSKEPAAFAHKGSLELATGKLGAPASESMLRGGEFVPGKGKANGRTARLGDGDEVLAALTGSLVPVAVESADGSLVGYSAWHELATVQPGAAAEGLKAGQPIGIPSVRVYNGATGTDRLVASGADSPALSRDGRLAFMRGDQQVARLNEEYTGQVVVGSATRGRFEQWTTESARYFPYAWAGATLLLYKGVPQSEATDLYAFTGPGAGRLLASDAFVVAVSPDGARLAVTVGRRMVEVISVSDGAVQASIPLDGDGVAAADSSSTPHFLMYSGSWRGNRVVANSDLGLVVLDVSSGIRIESVLATPEFAHGIVEPTFTDDTHVIGWADLADGAHPAGKSEEPSWDHALVSCDLAARACTSGDPQPARSWTRWIDNPSR